MAKKLRDEWEMSGNDLSQLGDLLADLDGRTTPIHTTTQSCGLVTVMNITEDEARVYLHSGGRTTQEIIPLAENGLKDSDMMGEMAESRLMLRIGKLYYPATDALLKTLCQRAGCGAGGDLIRCHDAVVQFHRDAAMSRYMGLSKKEMQIIIRADNGINKAFAAMTSRYALISQKKLFDEIIGILTAEMGGCDHVRYTVNNYLTTIYVEFPEKARDFSMVYKLPKEVIPGALIMTSDTGECSCSIYGTFRTGNYIQYAPAAVYKRAHTINATLAEIEKGIRKNIFRAYRELPQRLCELMTIDVTDPAETIRKVAQEIHMKKELGSQEAEKAIAVLTANVSSGTSYTAYDIAMWFMELGDEICGEAETNRSQTVVDKRRNIFLAAAFARYN